MTGCEEDSAFAALDAHIRTQLTRAAETYAWRVDLDAKLKAILQAETSNDQNDTATE
jgi:hypothetical protein